MRNGLPTALAIALLMAPLPWLLLRSCDREIAPRQSESLSCGVGRVAPGNGVLCIRYPGACKASMTVVRVEGEPEREWQPKFFPASSSIPFDRPVLVKSSLGEQYKEWQVTATRDKPVVEVMIPHEDVPSLHLLGYRRGEIPDETGLRAIGPGPAAQPVTRLFEWWSGSLRGCPIRTGVVVDANGRVYRSSWPCGRGPERWWAVGEIDPATFRRMRALRDEAVKASMIRVGPEGWSVSHNVGVRAYGAPGTAPEGVVLAKGGESDAARRVSPATDIIVPWMLRLSQIAPWPEEDAP